MDVVVYTTKHVGTAGKTKSDHLEWEKKIDKCRILPHYNMNYVMS